MPRGPTFLRNHQKNNQDCNQLNDDKGARFSDTIRGGRGQNIFAIFLETTLRLFVVEAARITRSQSKECLIGRDRVPFKFSDVLDISFSGWQVARNALSDIDTQGSVFLQLAKRRLKTYR